MNLHIYQSYYLSEQISKLDPNLIPFDNSNGSKELLEYGIFKEIYPRHTELNDYWGVLSWKYLEKINIPSNHIKGWITSNPGYDVYFINPHIDIIKCYNLWIQGEEFHPGMIEYCDSLLNELGYNFSIQELEYTADEFSSCHYIVGNRVFWSSYLRWTDRILKISINNIKMNQYLFEKGTNHYGLFLKNFPFVFERLFTLYWILHPTIKIKKYPYEASPYDKKWLEFYYQKKTRDQEILACRDHLLTK